MSEYAESEMKKILLGWRPVEAAREVTAPSSVLPTEAGFYWWRETEADAWRMVQIVDCGGGHLNSYDVQLHNWGGRSLKAWVDWFPIGQWLAVFPPSSVARRQS